MRLTTREQITPSVIAPDRSKFRLPRAHRRDLEADCLHYCGQKKEPRRGSTSARAAQGMATTFCYGKFLPDRGQKISCRLSLMTAPPLPHSRLKPPCGAGDCLLRLAMHRRSTAGAAFGVFVRRQIGDVFLIWIRILCLAHFSWFPFGFVARAAQRSRTAVRRSRMVTGFF